MTGAPSQLDEAADPDAAWRAPGGDEASASDEALSPAEGGALLVAIMVVALCGIVYELIIGAISSYLLGDSVYQFSMTIGFFMFAMGIGAYLSKFITTGLIESFVRVEIALAVVGGVSGLALFFTFPQAPAFFQFVQFFFILVIGGLVGLEIPLLTRALAKAAGARKSLAHVLSIDYLGALIGSVAFPLLLLPSLGLLRASFAIGLINAGVAVLTVACLRKRLRRWRAMMAASLAALAALVALTLLGARLTSFAQDHLYLDDVLYREQSAYQSLIVTQDQRKRDIRLFIDGHIQFSELDEHRYHEMLTHGVMRGARPEATVLVMGGGDGLALRELLRREDVARIDLVDLDPAMTRLGREFAPLRRMNGDALRDPRVRVWNMDAFVFIRERLEGAAERYDRVILDFPDPHNEALSKLYSVEFYAMLRRRLAADGAVITQSSSPFFATRTFWSIAATLETAFPVVEPYQLSVPSFGVWGFNLARLGPAPAEELPLGAPTRFLDREVLAAARVFPRDMARPEGVVANSIFEPTLYRTYLEDLIGPGPALTPLGESEPS